MSEAPDPKENGKGKKAEGRWALFTGIGSFLLYFFGYLSLRFHLSVLGVGTGLAVLDERYLFAGAQFLVFLVTSAPVALVLVFVARWLVRRWRPPFLRSPERMIVSGVVVSIVLIEFFVRKCLPFTNLLLRHELPPYPLFQVLLLDETEAIQSLYFSFLLASVIGLAWLLIAAGGRGVRSWPVMNWVFALLVLIQFLMLPVTFGILIADQYVPRVTTIDGKEMLKSDLQAWRVWEGKDSVTFFVRRWDKKGCETQRTLLTLENEGIEKTEISGYDRVLRLLYGWPGDPVSGCKAEEGVKR